MHPSTASKLKCQNDLWDICCLQLQLASFFSFWCKMSKPVSKAVIIHKATFFFYYALISAFNSCYVWKIDFFLHSFMSNVCKHTGLMQCEPAPTDEGHKMWLKAPEKPSVCYKFFVKLLLPRLRMKLSITKLSGKRNWYKWHMQLTVFMMSWISQCF